MRIKDHNENLIGLYGYIIRIGVAYDDDDDEDATGWKQYVNIANKYVLIKENLKKNWYLFQFNQIMH